MTIKPTTLAQRGQSASEIPLDDLLDMPLEELDNVGKVRVHKLDYYNRTIRGQSYSRSTTLHACPRKYEISTKFKLRPERATTTFAYGHALGTGIQSAIAGKSRDHCILDAIIAYDFPYAACEDEKTIKDGKTIWNVVQMVHRFYELYKGKAFQYLDGWEIAKFETPTGTVDGIELTFVISMGVGDDGIERTYEGHIDLVLYHPERKRYLILELKTTGGNVVQEAAYRNSKQALGYGVVLDIIAHNFASTASFDVLYMVVKSKTEEIIPFQFTKTYRDKAEFLLSIQDDQDLIDRYEQLGYYPMRGESCNAFFSPCTYIDNCAESNETLEAMQVATTMDNILFSQMEKPTFYFTLEEVLEVQQKLMQYTERPRGGEIEMLLSVETLR